MEKPGVSRLVPHQFKMGDESRREHDIDRTVPAYLVGNKNFAALGVFGRGRHGADPKQKYCSRGGPRVNRGLPVGGMSNQFHSANRNYVETTQRWASVNANQPSLSRVG